ncbi:hypothetical protein [Ekhidna sp.]
MKPIPITNNQVINVFFTIGVISIGLYMVGYIGGVTYALIEQML